MSWAIAAAVGLQVFNGVSSAQSISANSAIQKQVADINANYAEVDAYNAVQEGNTKASLYQNTIDQTIGAGKVSEAAGNVDVGFGTASEIEGQSRLAGFMNSLQIKQQAAQKALGYDVQANNIRLGGATGTIAAQMQETSALIGGAANAASTYATGYGKPNTTTQPNEFMSVGTNPGGITPTGYLGAYNFNE